MAQVLETPRGVPGAEEHHTLKGGEVAAGPALALRVGAVETVVAPPRGGVVPLPETVPHGRGVGGVTVPLGVPVPVVGVAARPATPEGHPVAKPAPACAPPRGPQPVAPPKTPRPVRAAPGAVPLALAGAGGHARASGHPLPRGAQEVVRRAVVVAETPLRRLLHGPIDGRVETIARVLLDVVLGTRPKRHLSGATLLQGPPIGGVVRPLEDRDRLEALGAARGAPVEGATSQVGGWRVHT